MKAAESSISQPDAVLTRCPAGGSSALPNDLVEAYRTTDYHVYANDGFEPFTLNVGRVSPELADILKKHKRASAAFITAWNPLGRALSDSENAHRNALLQQELVRRSLPHWPGQGKGSAGDWPGEDSFLVLGLDLAAAARLATEVEQNALVWADGRATPQLILLR